jgi:CRP-like cAMP-binding protein
MNFHDFLQTVPELAELTSEETAVLERSMVVKDYPDDFEFFRENKPSKAIYLIVKGEVAVTHEKEGERGLLEIKRLYSGEWFGLVSLIAGIKHDATCKAAGPVQAASLPREAFKFLYAANAPIALHFQRIVARQRTRDYRAMTELLHQVIFAESKDEAQAKFNELVSRYNGPDRRMPESSL